MIHPFEERCTVCGSDDLHLNWREHTDGRRHIQGRCAKCGIFRMWVAATPEAKAEADAAEPTPNQGSLFDVEE